MKEKISSFGAGLFQKPSESVRREIDRINTKRLMVAAVIMMTINGVSFFLLSTQKVEATQLVQTWREGVLRSHGILFFVNAAIGLSAYFLRDKEHLKRLRRALPYVALIGILASGGVITIFDQCITANITPFVITSIGGAAIF
ncbi:MAG TPA: hypothetical protein DHN33_05110, partial [Eubacteriaceae bacterium]|nr:hypothetical protein [Eubacteriaceae bacterium]